MFQTSKKRTKLEVLIEFIVFFVLCSVHDLSFFNYSLLGIRRDVQSVLNHRYTFWILMVIVSVGSYSLDGYSLTDRNAIGKGKYLLWSSPNILWNGAITRKKYQLVLTTTIGDTKVGTIVILKE